MTGRSPRRAALHRAAVALVLLTGLVLPARAQLLYRAERGDRTVYLLGSVHLLPRSGAALGPAVEAAYRASGALAVELTPEAMASAAPLVLARGLLPSDSLLTQLLPDSVQARLSPYLDGPLGGILPRARPWLAALLIGQVALAEAGYSPEAGVEGQLFARAQADHRPVHAFETVEEQLALLTGDTPGAQVAALNTALVQASGAVARLDTLVAQWRAGDVGGLEASLTAAFTDVPAQRARLLDARNRAWLPRLSALAANTPTLLVVVGAGHLVGEAGLAALLRADGWRMTQVPAQTP